MNDPIFALINALFAALVACLVWLVVARVQGRPLQRVGMVLCGIALALCGVFAVGVFL